MKYSILGYSGICQNNEKCSRKNHSVSISSIGEFKACGSIKRVRNELRAVEIDAVHIDRDYTTVIVGFVIVNSLVGVYAARVDRVFVFTALKLAASALLFDRAEDVEELTDALGIGIG